MNFGKVKLVIFLSTLILLFAYPAFSYDIFNYIVTAKVSFLYKENPYIIMPIEIRNEPMLAFMHAANKTALYGPSWISLSFIPYILGLNNLLFTIFTFKLFTALFYVGLIYLIWKLSEKNIISVAFFALNPLVLIETLVSGHNDVVMMFFSVLSFYFLRRRNLFFSIIAILVSILIKYATIFLLPVFIYVLWNTIKKEKINWEKVWFWSAMLMLTVFFLSPLREEIYPWYFIWPLTFISLIGEIDLLFYISLGFSLGLSFRMAPFIYTNNWLGFTPYVKKIVTFGFPLIFVTFYGLKKKI